MSVIDLVLYLLLQPRDDYCEKFLVAFDFLFQLFPQNPDLGFQILVCFFFMKNHFIGKSIDFKI